MMNRKAINCALQHIKIFRDQALRNALADFGEPCEKCSYIEKCDFKWLSILHPLLNRSDVEINLVTAKQNLQQDKDLSEIERCLKELTRV